MKPTKLLWISLLFVLLIGLYLAIKPNPQESSQSLTQGSRSIESYTARIINQRKDKDNFFRTNAESPLENKSTFSGLIYYPISPDYRITARFDSFADKTQKLIVRLSDGSEEIYEKYGHAVFRLQDEVCRLLIVKHDGTFSILFKDVTSGKTTYGGGRYIDLEESAFSGNEVTIDFNMAYNPYCVYNHTYACPLPPAENTLPVAVEAGEKMAESGKE